MFLMWLTLTALKPLRRVSSMSLSPQSRRTVRNAMIIRLGADLLLSRVLKAARGPVTAMWLMEVMASVMGRCPGVTRLVLSRKFLCSSLRLV